MIVATFQRLAATTTSLVATCNIFHFRIAEFSLHLGEAHIALSFLSFLCEGSLIPKQQAPPLQPPTRWGRPPARTHSKILSASPSKIVQTK